MSKTRKPLVIQKGNLTTEQQLLRKKEEECIKTGTDQLDKVPVWLIDRTAKNEYKRVVTELKNINIIGNLDKNNIAAYCNAYANYLNVTKKLKDEEYLIERDTRTGTIVIKNPLIGVQTEYANEMRKFAALCGMTIDSRLKAAAIETTRTEQDINAKFGAI